MTRRAPAIDEILSLVSPRIPKRRTIDQLPTFGDIKSHANVIVFGKALSKAAIRPSIHWHGAGAQRSSIKTLDDQALTDEDLCSVNACDVDRPDNFVRCVR